MSTATEQVVSTLRLARDLIRARGYNATAWDPKRDRGVNIRTAIGAVVPDYDTHVSVLQQLSAHLPSTPRGKRFTGISDWETYNSRSGDEVLEMLSGVIDQLESST